MYDKEAARAQARASRGELIKRWDEEEGGARATASPPSGDTFGIEAQARGEWERSGALRTEFGELERYLAFKKAEAKGLVRIISRKP